MTTVYLMRHSEVLKPLNYNNNDTLEIQNEKWTLSEFGEKLAFAKSLLPEFIDFDVVISSNYLRAIATAKYFTEDLVIIDEGFNPITTDLEGALNEDINRQMKSLDNLLKKYSGKKILIVGDTASLSSLISHLINDKEYFKGSNWKYLESFKLTFNNNKELINFSHITH